MAVFNYECNPVGNDCSGNSEGCYINPVLGATTCTNPVFPAGVQGDHCSVLNSCEPGFGCILPSFDSPIGYACAKYCDTTAAVSGCQSGETCVSMNQQSLELSAVPNNVGYCQASGL